MYNERPTFVSYAIICCKFAVGFEGVLVSCEVTVPI